MIALAPIVSYPHSHVYILSLPSDLPATTDAASHLACRVIHLPLHVARRNYRDA